MNRVEPFAVAAAASVMVSACAGDPAIQREISVALAPMPKPAAVPADLTLTNRGEPYRVEVVAAEGDRVTRRVAQGRNAGCTYTNDGWFSPNSAFRNCGGSSGTNAFTKTGDIWPLKVGKTESYQIRSSEGTLDTRSCVVKAAVVVQLQEWRLPSYEVVCRSTWSTRIWYVSPELELPVRYRLFHNTDGLVDDVEVVLE